jgi:hypothetical protein
LQAKADLSLSPTGYFMHAFDNRTGEMVWEYRMKEPPFGTPMDVSARWPSVRKRGE